MQPTEPICRDDENRFVMFPIRYPNVWDMYKKAVSAFWTAEELDLTHDGNDWELLSSNEQHFVKHVLAFFAASDGIVNENLAARFLVDVKIPEARAFYSFQIAMETIHSEVYSLLIETLFSLDGLGLLSYESVMKRDYPVVMGTLFLFTLIGLVTKLVTDLCYVWVDPRVKFEAAS